MISYQAIRCRLVYSQRQAGRRSCLSDIPSLFFCVQKTAVTIFRPSATVIQITPFAIPIVYISRPRLFLCIRFYKECVFAMRAKPMFWNRHLSHHHLVHRDYVVKIIVVSLSHMPEYIAHTCFTSFANKISFVTQLDSNKHLR